MLVGEQVLNAIYQSYHNNSHQALADRLLIAMQAGADKGGDYRGIRSAALKVWNNRHIQTLIFAVTGQKHRYQRFPSFFNRFVPKIMLIFLHKFLQEMNISLVIDAI
ncbi:DUF1028 domain-containing protein [Providencia rettgeri]